jgi:hypothetical protein
LVKRVNQLGLLIEETVCSAPISLDSYLSSQLGPSDALISLQNWDIFKYCPLWNGIRILEHFSFSNAIYAKVIYYPTFDELLDFILFIISENDDVIHCSIVVWIYLLTTGSMMFLSQRILKSVTTELSISNL